MQKRGAGVHGVWHGVAGSKGAESLIKGISLGVMHFSASEEMRANDLGASDVFTIIWKDNSEIIRSCPSK